MFWVENELADLIDDALDFCFDSCFFYDVRDLFRDHDSFDVFLDLYPCLYPCPCPAHGFYFVVSLVLDFDLFSCLDFGYDFWIFFFVWERKFILLFQIYLKTLVKNIYLSLSLSLSRSFLLSLSLPLMALPVESWVTATLMNPTKHEGYAGGKWDCWKGGKK